MRNRIAYILKCFLGVLVIGTLPSPASSADVPKKVPVSITADKLDYDRTNDVYTAVGHVKIDQQDIHVEADRIIVNNRTGEAVADGNVYVVDKDNVLMADRIEVNLNTRAGIITKGNVFMSKENYHLRGERIERRSETVYHVEDGIFTTCDQGEWYLKAQVLDIDLDRYATGKAASFNMAGLPVLYTPYLLFPVRRQSGLLIPELGFSSTDGFLMRNAFFWAISDSRDMTFISDYRAKTGHGTGVEYRYVNSRDSAGRAFYNYFDTFHSGVSRWEFKFEHREEFAEDLSFRSDLTFVSDENYYRDLSKRLELRSLPYLDANAFYVERWNTASLYLLGQYSTDLTQPNNKTLQKLPELSYTIYGEPITSWAYLRFEGSATNVTSKEGKSVLRADFKPEIASVLSGSGMSFSPRFGARATYYDQSATTTEPAERKYVYVGADLIARMSRVYGKDVSSGIGRTRHSIEPIFSYSYIPKIDESDIPHLDAVDEVKEENLLSLSLINRLTARYQDASGVRSFDVMAFKLSMSYDVNEARRKDIADPKPRSDLLGELYFKTPKLLTVSALANYNTYIDRVTTTSESISLKTDPIQVDVSHQYLRDPRTRFLIAGLGYKIGKWDLNGQVWWDVENNAYTQQTYKAHYASQCWGIGLTYQSKPGERLYLFVLDLKGLGAMKF
jgi:LPS-assembly protein